ncbi:hypothetical protein K1719_026469 [Acacia pycnantha]|nr:hypothetical protein K1719_026469 [Acacia pycnantha]
MMEEELQRMKEASQSDPSTAIQAPQRPPRHKKWKAARMKGTNTSMKMLLRLPQRSSALTAIIGLSPPSSRAILPPPSHQEIICSTSNLQY